MKEKIAVITIIIFLFACTSPIRNLSKLQFQSPDFSRSSLIDGGLALLPITAKEEEAAFRHSAEEHLSTAITAFEPDIPFLASKESIEKLNEANLAQGYLDMLDTYERAATLDKATLVKMGSALNKSYLMQAKFVKFHLGKKTTEYDPLTGTTPKPGWNEVEIFAQIWDTQKGEIVWEGVGKVMMSSSTQFIRAELDKIIREVCKGLIEKLPKF